MGGWGLERAEGLRSGGRGAGPSGDQTDGRSFVRSFVRSGPLPKKGKTKKNAKKSIVALSGLAAFCFSLSAYQIYLFSLSFLFSDDLTTTK